MCVYIPQCTWTHGLPLKCAQCPCSHIAQSAYFPKQSSGTFGDSIVRVALHSSSSESHVDMLVPPESSPGSRCEATLVKWHFTMTSHYRLLIFHDMDSPRHCVCECVCREVAGHEAYSAENSGTPQT